VTAAVPDFADLFDHAPCGYVTTRTDGTIVDLNATLVEWLGYAKQDLIGRRFTTLLSAAGRIYYETHFAPLLQLHSRVDGIAIDLVAADRTRLSVLLAANLTNDEPQLIRTVVFDARDRRSYEQELLRAREEAESERSRVHALAATLQRTLLPPRLSPPSGMEVAAYYHPASVDDVGGDFYDVFPLGAGRWALFLGDVVGKGVDAAVITSLTRYTLRAAAILDQDPITVLNTLDTALHQEYPNDNPRFCTVVFGVLTPCDTGYTVELASGGHPPPLVIRVDGSVQYQEMPGGQLVGILSSPHFESTTLDLGPGDTLVFYTDGLTEARLANSRNRYDDSGALLEFAAAHAPTTARAITTALEQLLTSLGDGLEDDTAILALGIPAG